MVVSVRSLLFDKGEYIMKLSQKKWKSLISGVLLAASASSFLIAPVYAADYSKPLIGTLKKDSEILSPDGNTVTENDGKLIYDFQGKDHTFTITNKDGITACKDSVYNNVGADGSYGTIHINQTNTKRNAYVGVNGFIANKGTVIVNSNLDITAASEYSSVGIAAANKGNLIINGNVKMRKDDAENPWGIITKNVHGNVGPGGGAASMGGDENYTGARWQPAGISVDYSRGDITVNGDVDIAVRGTAVKTDVYQADGDVPAYDLGTISLLGNFIRIDTPYREENFVEGFGKFIEPYYALASYGGTINVNVKNQEAQNGKVEMVGNVLAMKSSDEAGKAMVYQNGRLNIGLTTQDSSWKGVIDNAGTAKAGEVNLWLQNGAQWIYENASRKDGLDAANMPSYSRPYYEKYDGISHLSSLVGGKDKSSAGIIKVNDNDPIHIANAEGVTKVWYEHDDAAPGTIIGGDIKVLNAKAGSEMMLYTGNNGISKGFDDGDTAAEKNNVSEVLNSLAHKLWYMAGDSNLAGSVSIAEGLTASSVTMKTGNITFAEGGQGFYDYTPEEDKTDYKTGAIAESENISKTRKLDINGVAHVDVTEPTTNSGYAKLASALYAGEATYSSDPMIVDMGGKGLALSATTGTGQAAAIYANDNAYINVVNPSAEQKLTITSNNTSTTGAHGIYAKGNAHLNISGPVEITDVTTKGDAANGISIQGEKSEIKIDGSLKISNVKGIRERGKGINASGILVTGDTSSVTVTGPVDISGVRGSGIKLAGKDTKVAVGGGNITAAEDSDKSHNFYAVRVEKGTLDINMKDGAAGDTTTKITGDMYATGQYGKKVVEYTGGELINWADAGILNVALTNDKSFWKGVAAYDQYNSDYGSGGNTMHDIGQINLYLQNGAAWTNEQQSHVTTTTVSKAEWGGSTLASLHGGSNAANAGLIYQKDNNPISVVNYSGHTTVFYEHDAADPTNIIGGDFNITNAAKGSAITFVTDNTGITSGFEDGDSAEAKDNVANVLNSMAGKLFYKNYTDGHLAGVVKIADGLTASSAALKTGDISFSTEETGTFTPGQGYYDYKTSKPGSQIAKEFTTAITGDAAADTVYIEKGVLKDDGTYVFTADSTTITPEKHLIAGGAWLPQISAAISGSDENHNVTIDMNGNKLTVDTTTDTHTTGIAAVGKGVVNINNTGAMAINATSTTNGQTGALFVNAGGTINIHNAGADNVLTLRASSAAPANAAVIKSMNGVSGVMSAITVDGLVDILADKSNASGANEAISAVASKVEIGGGVIKAINGAEYAISAYGEFASKNRGQVNMNVKKDAEGAIIGAGNNNVQMEGNVNLGGGMDSAGASADVSIGLNTRESFWKGDVSNANGSSTGIVNLYMGNGASWTGNNLSGNTVNADLDNATWTGYSNGNAMHLKLDNSIWNVNGASKLASFSGNNGSIIVANNAGDINVADYSGNTNVIYNHDADNPTNIHGGSFTVGQAKEGSNITLITDNQGITKGFNAYDKAEDQNTVNEVLNKLAQKLFYTANDGKLAGTVKIASGLTASSAALKTGDISFSTDATGTKTPGQGFYKYNEIDDTVITDPITGNLDKKYVSLGIETEKGIYNFTKDTVINVTKGDYSSNLSAIESSGGPITINADGKNLDVSYHVLKGSNVARAVATGLSYGKSKDITIKAKSLKLSTDTTGFRAQGVYATGGKITIDADTTISTSAQTESNGIYSGSGGTVTMNGNLDIQKDSKAANYIALNSDDNGIINVNVKNGKAGAGIVKIDGDVYTKSAETYDYWEDETTSTSSTVNLALQGKDSSWNGRSLYEVTSGDDSTSYGTFNLWLTDGATWTNEKNGKEVPSGFTGSHVTNFTGGADAAHAGNIFQKDSKNLTVDNYSGNINIYYAHSGNGEAAGDYKAGDTVIKHAEKDSVVSLITDNSGVNMSSADSIVNVLNSLAGKLTYSNFVNGEKNLTGLVKIADGLTASSAALKTGNIAFSTEDGKGSLKKEDVKPEPPTPTYPEDQKADKFDQGITGDDEKYKEEGVQKEDGSYVFTQNPTVIEVKEGAAVGATDKDIVIDTTKAKLELKGETGINAEGANVNIKGNTDISGKVGINAANGNVTLNGSTVINGTDAAINAGADANVVVNGNNSALTVNGSINADGGNITVDSGKASSTIKGDINAANGGSVAINLTEKNSSMTGSYNVDGESSIVMNVKNGAVWKLTDDEAAGMSLLRMAKAPAAATAKGLTVNGGATKAETGYLDMTKRTKDLKIASYSGWETIIYGHENDGADVADYKSGDTIIDKAEKGSGVILSTDNSNNRIDMKDKNAVEATLKALAQKVTYKDHEANGGNLTGKVQIADGLTSSSKGVNIGTLHWDENGKGKYNLDSINWNQIIEGDYETFVMKGVRSAATTSLHTWRDNMQDTYTGADMADEDGMFAKALGGKTSSDIKGLKDSNTYYGVQVGYDKAAANGWHTGVAFDYRNGDSNYLLGGKGDNQMYSLGVYGVKNFENDAFFRVAAKVGRVENEYDVYNEIRSLKLHGDYKSNAYGLTMEYGKTFGDEEAYFTPKAQLTWSQVGAKDYTAHTENATMQISQDSYSSFVGRLGFEAGVKSEKGRVYAGLFAAHEFNGDISASYFANDGDRKHTSFNGEETWMEMKLGGTYDFSNNAHLYADIAKDFNGNFERKWKLNVGLRFEF